MNRIRFHNAFIYKMTFFRQVVIVSRNGKRMWSIWSCDRWLSIYELFNFGYHKILWNVHVRRKMGDFISKSEDWMIYTQISTDVKLFVTSLQPLWVFYCFVSLCVVYFSRKFAFTLLLTRFLFINSCILFYT